jgi:hypothetical protein
LVLVNEFAAGFEKGAIPKDGADAHLGRLEAPEEEAVPVDVFDKLPHLSFSELSQSRWT